MSAPDTPPILHLFRALHTAPERRAAITALAADLDHNEWRLLKDMANARPFHCDIVASLPPELLFHIFQYLDITTPFRLQTVSRRWYALLRSPDLLKQPLRHWLRHPNSLQHATYDHLLASIQSIQRFRTGNCLEVAVSKPQPEPAKRIALVGDFLIDIPYPFRHLRVTNLRTGAAWQARTDAREELDRFFASDQLIVCWAQAHSPYVFDYASTRLAKLHLPPFMNSFRSCSGRTFICGGIRNHHIELYIWSRDSLTGKTLRLDQGPFARPIESPKCLDIQLIPEPRSQTLTLFTTKTCETRWCGHPVRDLTINYYVVTFDGQVLQDNQFKIPLAPQTNHIGGASITSINPFDNSGGYLIKVFCRYNHDGFDRIFHFDANLQAFREPEQALKPSEHVKCAGWKGTFYQTSMIPSGQAGPLHVECDLISKSGGYTRLFRDTSFIEDLIGVEQSSLLVNEKFVVVAAFNSVYVASFADRAKTADPAASCGEEDEKQGKLVLWRRRL